MAVPMGLLQTRTTQGSAEDKPSTKTLVFDTPLLNRKFDRMSALGHKQTFFDCRANVCFRG